VKLFPLGGWFQMGGRSLERTGRLFFFVRVSFKGAVPPLQQFARIQSIFLSKKWAGGGVWALRWGEEEG